MHGTRNHGGRSATAATNAKMPQANTSTQIGTTIFCAASMPTRFAARSNATSNKILFHCFAMYSPGACPFSINCASQTLYTWLARSPASIRRCQQHGVHMASQVPSLDSAVPPARNQDQRRKQENRSAPASGKSPTLPEFAFVGGKIFSQAQTSLRHSTSALHFGRHSTIIFYRWASHARRNRAVLSTAQS